jgi:hypothetical protein
LRRRPREVPGQPVVAPEDLKRVSFGTWISTRRCFARPAESVSFENNGSYLIFA